MNTMTPETIAPAVSPLRQLIGDASSALDVYKSPNIDEALGHLDTLLTSAGLGSIQHDRVVRIDECADHFEIHTEWSARGCAQTSQYELPYIIVDAADPIAAAVTWARQQAMDTAQERVRKAESDLRYAQEAYAKAQALPA